ncbi:MAG TPA: hypothetical protein VMS12_00355 [Thermoanaerobaculia bacterium]|nr:hypothetical protein [Thermoanaerobaculia bacterium]
MRELLESYMPTNASAHGPALDNLTVLIHWVMAILFVGWSLYFIYVLYRFRASRNPRASYEGSKSHVHSYAEVGVAVVEVVLLIGFSIPLWSRWITPDHGTRPPLEIRVVSEQFAWNIHYPGPDGRFGRTDINLVSASNPLGIDPTDPNAADDFNSVNQLHLEVNRPVVVLLSAKDVIHSFALPVMRVKQDAIPGMEMPVYFTPVKTNNGEVWEIACAQLCGLGHYRMRGSMVVHTPEEFEKWLASNAPVPAVDAVTAPPTGVSEPVAEAPPEPVG